ncbi:zinc ribbon domain-containing protein [Catenibacterium mitsuokai]|uniref:zinc ribbon domain-containing protein n=1 Tax=Catenibacterium mitsuokai TaxID=100886 RepID=UPI002E78C591|nr:zinc ribbon domain-containing protein [Catenibacterium tridentinum]
MISRIIEKAKETAKFISNNRKMFDPRKNIDKQTILYLIVGISWFLPVYVDNGKAFHMHVTAMGGILPSNYPLPGILKWVLFFVLLILYLFVFISPLLLYINHILEKQENSGQYAKNNVIICLAYMGFYQYILARNENTTIITVVVITILIYCTILNFSIAEKNGAIIWNSKTKKANIDLYEKSKKPVIILSLFLIVAFIVLPVCNSEGKVSDSFFGVSGPPEYAKTNISLLKLAKGFEYTLRYEGLFEITERTVSAFGIPIVFSLLIIPIAILIIHYQNTRKQRPNMHLLNLNVLLSAIYLTLLSSEFIGLIIYHSSDMTLYFFSMLIMVIAAVLLAKECEKIASVDFAQFEPLSNASKAASDKVTETTEVINQNFGKDLREENEAKESSQKPKQRFCTNCGAEIMEGTKFCTKCGMPIENDENE